MARESSPEDLDRTCTQYDASSKIGADSAKAVLEGAAAMGTVVPLESTVDKWHYVKL